MVARKMQSSGAISFNDIRTRLLDNDSAGGISLYGADSDGGLARQTLFDSAGGFNTAISLDDYYGAYPFPDHCLTLDLPASVKDSDGVYAGTDLADRINTPLNIQCDNTEGVGFNFAIYFSNVLRTNTNHPSYNEVHIYKETTSGNFSELLVIDAARLLSDTGRNVYFPSNQFQQTHVFNRTGTRLAINIYELGSTTASGDDEGGFVVYKRSGSTWSYADHILRGHADFSYLSAGDDVEPYAIVSSGNSGNDFENIVVSYGYEGIELYFVQASNGVISPATDIYPASQVQADYGGLHLITRKGEDGTYFYMRDPITPYGIGRVSYSDLSSFTNKYVLSYGNGNPIIRSPSVFQNFGKYTNYNFDFSGITGSNPRIHLYLNTTSTATLMYSNDVSPAAMSSMPNWLSDRTGNLLAFHYVDDSTAVVAVNEAFMVCITNIRSDYYSSFYGPVMWFAQRNYARDGDVNNSNDSRFKQMYNLSSPISNVGQTGQSHYAFKNPPFNHFNSANNVPFSQFNSQPTIAGGGEDGARFIIWVSSGSGQLQFFSLNQGGTTG